MIDYLWKDIIKIIEIDIIDNEVDPIINQIELYSKIDKNKKQKVDNYIIIEVLKIILVIENLNF